MKIQWEKFKHRTLTKVFLGYAVVAWVLIQVIEAVLPTFETPLWVAQTITFLLILGFPIAILVGWASEKLPISSTSSAEETTPQLAHETSRRTLVWIGVGSCVVVGLFGFYMMPFIFDQEAFDTQQGLSMAEPTGPNYRSRRYSVMLGATGLRGIHNTRTDIAISPDGTMLAYLDNRNGGSALFVKDLQYTDSVRSLGALDITNGSGLMFFSQDGEWLHFINGSRMNRVRLEGGAFQNIESDISVLRSSFTSFDQRIIFSSTEDGKLYSIPTSGGDATILPMSSDAEADRAFTWPRILPGNEFLLVTTSDGPDRVGAGNVQIYGLEDSSLRVLVRNASNATYINSGHIVFLRDSDLWAVPFDLETMTIVGSQVPVINGVETNSQYGHATYTVSDNGQLFYLAGTDGGGSIDSGMLTWADFDGERAEIEVDAGSFSNINFSPDETRLAFTSTDDQGGTDIFMWDLTRKTLSRRTFDGISTNPIWSVDGTRLIYSNKEEGIKSVAANGSDQPSVLFETNSVARPYSIAPSGEVLFDMGSPPRIYLFDPSANSDSEAEMLAEEIDLGPDIPPFHGSRISPDGNWIAYTSNEIGQPRVFVRSFPNTDGGKWQVSESAAFQPLWNMSSGELYFSSFGSQHMAEFEIGPSGPNDKPEFIEFRNPQTIFARSVPASATTQNTWDYSLTRNQFILVEPEIASIVGADDSFSESLTNLVAVENWFAELSELAPRDAN